MIAAWTGRNVRDAEQPLLDAGQGDILISRAAHGLALHCVRVLRSRCGVPGASVVVLAGSGHNGADAIWAATALRRRGVAVQVVLTGATAHQGAYQAGRAAGVRYNELDQMSLDDAVALCLGAEMIVDGIVGTGANGGLRCAARELVAVLNEHFAAAGRRHNTPVVVAVDIASGVDTNTGICAQPVLAAEHTVSFGGAKVGHVLPPGCHATGTLTCVDIGIEHNLPVPPVIVVEPADLARLWPCPDPHDHKYTRGVLGVIAGSRQYPGAALLCVRSAVAAGVGMVRFVGEPGIGAMVTAAVPDAVSSDLQPGMLRVNSWVAGPGAVGQIQQERIHEVIDLGHPAVLDAAACEVVGQVLGQRRLEPHHILTPHVGELLQLLRWSHAWGLVDELPSREDVEQNPLLWVRRTACATGATVVLKGSVTICASPSGPACVVRHGSSWLAAAGSGDCLAGMMGALMAHVQARPEVFARNLTRWVGDASLSQHIRDQLAAQLTGEAYWALVAAVGAGMHASASRVNEGPQGCSPEHIRAAVAAAGRTPRDDTTGRP